MVDTKEIAKVVTNLSVENLESKLLQMKQEKCPVTHSFGPGIYIREVRLPAGSFVIGHKQKTEHLNIFLSGKFDAIKPDGSIERMEAPQMFTSPPGRKMGYIIEDVVWLNVYATEETDIETLEKMYLDKSSEWIAAQPRLEPRIEDQIDFEYALADLGVTAQQVEEESFREDDLIQIPPGSYNFGIFPSLIHGHGVFAVGNYTEGCVVGPARIGIHRTPLGRYTNHGKCPNCKMVRIENDIFLVTTREIEGSCGGILGEELTIDYRNVVTLGEIVCQE